MFTLWQEKFKKIAHLLSHLITHSWVIKATDKSSGESLCIPTLPYFFLHFLSFFSISAVFFHLQQSGSFSCWDQLEDSIWRSFANTISQEGEFRFSPIQAVNFIQNWNMPAYRLTFLSMCSVPPTSNCHNVTSANVKKNSQDTGSWK